MCFSAQASFVASVALTALGSYAVFKVKKSSRMPLAITPLIFAIQQAIEGVIWLAQTHIGLANAVVLATYAYLFFAFVFWPVWIPTAVLSLETNMDRKHVLLILLGVGISIATCLAYITLSSGAQAVANCSHIHYEVGLQPELQWLGFLLYATATIMPFFVSSKKQLWLFGVGLIASVGITYVSYAAFFTSVWCFFSAVLSLGIIWLI